MFNRAIFDWDKVNKRWIFKAISSYLSSFYFFFILLSFLLDIKCRCQDWTWTCSRRCSQQQQHGHTRRLTQTSKVRVFFCSLCLFALPLLLHYRHLEPGQQVGSAASTSLTPNNPPSPPSSGSQAAAASPSLKFPPANISPTSYAPAPHPIIFADVSSDKKAEHWSPSKKRGGDLLNPLLDPNLDSSRLIMVFT